MHDEPSSIVDTTNILDICNISISRSRRYVTVSILSLWITLFRIVPPPTHPFIPNHVGGARATTPMGAVPM